MPVQGGTEGDTALWVRWELWIEAPAAVLNTWGGSGGNYSSARRGTALGAPGGQGQDTRGVPTDIGLSAAQGMLRWESALRNGGRME